MKPYPSALPSFVDLRPDVDATIERQYPAKVPLLTKLADIVGWKIEDQGRVGSCTAFGSTTALEIIYERAGQDIQLSPLYQYYWTRSDGGRLGQDGASPAYMILNLQKRGVCLESTWPYDTSKVEVQPPTQADLEAEKFQISAFESTTMQDWPLRNWARNCIANGSPVMVSFNVTQDFIDQGWTQHNWRTFTWSGYPPNIGGHEVAIIGYDDSAKMFLCQNSWGPAWGDGGFFGMTYDKFEAITTSTYAITAAQVPLVPVDLSPVPVKYAPKLTDTIGQMLNAIYQESFRRDYDVEGATYWMNRFYTDFRATLRANALGDDAKNMVPD